MVTALERTCELEGRLRQAIQDTHPLTTTLDWDFEAADREREALLAIRRELHRGKLAWGWLLHRPTSAEEAPCQLPRRPG